MELHPKLKNLQETGWSLCISWSNVLGTYSWEIRVWKKLNPKGKFDKKRRVLSTSNISLEDCVNQIVKLVKEDKFEIV
jgi:hypothetical protein